MSDTCLGRPRGRGCEAQIGALWRRREGSGAVDACGQSSGHWIVKGGPWQREEGTRTEALGGLVGAGSAESLEDGDAAREPASGTARPPREARQPRRRRGGRARAGRRRPAEPESGRRSRRGEQRRAPGDRRSQCPWSGLPGPRRPWLHPLETRGSRRRLGATCRAS